MVLTKRVFILAQRVLVPVPDEYLLLSKLRIPFGENKGIDLRRSSMLSSGVKKVSIVNVVSRRLTWC